MEPTPRLVKRARVNVLVVKQGAVRREARGVVPEEVEEEGTVVDVEALMEASGTQVGVDVANQVDLPEVRVEEDQVREAEEEREVGSQGLVAGVAMAQAMGVVGPTVEG
ncbi:MAG: hypothetical protein SGPRY_001455 [Prymnesium sp.]